eukprot:gene26774-4357_t
MAFGASATPLKPTRVPPPHTAPPISRRSWVKALASKHQADYLNINRRSALLAAAGGASTLILPGGYALASVAEAVVPAITTTADAVSAIPSVEIAPGLNISRVVKGCWQLSGGHKGDASTDRTAGQFAVDDFETFVSNGITSLDVADHYGPGETLIGRYLRVHPERVADVQVLTKLCVFSSFDMVSLSKDYIDTAVATSRARLGVKPDLMQLYWNEYSLPKYTDAVKYLGDSQAASIWATAKLLVSGRQPSCWYLGDSQAAGKIGHIGATNFDTPRIQAMLDTVKLDTSSKGKYASVVQQRGGWTWFQELLTAM